MRLIPIHDIIYSDSLPARARGRSTAFRGGSNWKHHNRDVGQPFPSVNDVFEEAVDCTSPSYGRQFATGLGQQHVAQVQAVALFFVRVDKYGLVAV